jgi:predicted metal-binding protein
MAKNDITAPDSPITDENQARALSRPEPAFAHVLYICTGCNYSKTPDESKSRRGGNVLFAAVMDEIQRRGGAPVHVEPVACLSVCKDSCALALTAPDKYTYTFGWVAPDEASAVDILDMSALYAASPTGHIDRPDRPRATRRLISKVPPIHFDPDIDDDSRSARMAAQVPKPKRPW